MIQLFKVCMSRTVDKAVCDVLHSGYIGEGEKVKEFETAISDYIGNPNVLALNSCTSAIMMSLRLAGVGQGDYVISTPMTCLATNEPILALGAKPLWADIDPLTGNVSPNGVQAVFDGHTADRERIKAIMVVHWAGQPCDLDEINTIAMAYSVPVVEDAAHAFGAAYKSDTIGNHSDYVCFSFQAIKHLTTVDGGAIAFRDEKEKERGRLMRWYGLDRSNAANMRCCQDPPEFGYKFHMNNLNAAIGVENIKCTRQVIRRHRMHAAAYYDGLVRLEKVRLLRLEDDRVGSYWLFPILVDDAEKFIKYMKYKEVACSVVHARNDKKSIFRDSIASLPGVDEFCKHQVNVPVGGHLSVKDVKYIIKCIREY